MGSSVSQIKPQPYDRRSVWDLTADQSTYSKNVPVEKSFKAGNHLVKDIFLIVFGMILCGVPLAVMSTLYLQQKGTICSTSNTSDATTISTLSTATSTMAATSVTSVILPSQCTSYITNNDSTRNVAYGLGSYCDNTLTMGWYRFMGGAGKYLATSAVSRDTCATYYGGSYNGSLPLTAGTTAFGSLCLNNNGYICYAAWSGSLIGVTNCSGYYVYYLLPITNCNARYCTTN